MGVDEHGPQRTQNDTHMRQAQQQVNPKTTPPCAHPKKSTLYLTRPPNCSPNDTKTHVHENSNVTQLSKTIQNFTHPNDRASFEGQFTYKFWVMLKAICEQLLGQATWTKLLQTPKSSELRRNTTRKLAQKTFRI